MEYTNHSLWFKPTEQKYVKQQQFFFFKESQLNLRREQRGLKEPLKKWAKFTQDSEQAVAIPTELGK